MHKPIRLAGIACLVGGVLVLIGFAINGFKFSNFSKEDFEEKNYNCKNEINEIVVDNALYNAEITKENVDKIKIEYNDIKDDNQFEIDESGSTLKIKTKKKDKWNFFSFDSIGFNYSSEDDNVKNRKMKITVPEKFEGKMDISCAAGKMKVSDFKLEKLDVDLSAGEIDLGDIQVSKETKIKVGAGDLDVSKLSADNVNVDLSAGKIKMGELVSNNNIDINAGAADVDINKFEAKNDIKLECSVGSIDGKINGKKADYNVHKDVSVGSCSLDNQVGGSKDLDIKLGAGSIDVDFTES